MSKRSLLLFATAVLTFSTLSTAHDHKRFHQPSLTPQDSGTTQGLIAVSPVSSRTVWASGRGGTFVLTTDGGRHWTAGVVPGAEALEFRDVQGISSREAYLQSVGDNVGDFRIYKTVDGGKNWTLQFQNQTEGAFYDCFAFWSPGRGISHSDSVNGIFPDLRTTDGTNWEDISANMPPALPGEFSFASSGTCVATEGRKNAWITTGGASVARILATRDGGDTWNAYDTPLVSSPSAGGFTVAFRDSRHGIVGGGDLDPNDPNNAATAVSHDGGQTWTLTNPPPVTGAIFGLSYADDRHHHHGDHRRHHDSHDTVVITANDGGAAWTPNEGRDWFTLQDVSGFWAVAFAEPEAGWLVGTDGRILKISFQHHGR
jgi:photosystem II stability/assembly factor-like uncharacterized protein